MSSLWVRLLGKTCIHDTEQASIIFPLKAQELFFYLLIYHGQSHERDALSSQLWVDAPYERSKKYLRQALWQLQTTLNQYVIPDMPILILDRSWVQLDLTTCIWLDIEQLQQVFAQVRDIPAQTLTFEQAEMIRKTIPFYQGELLTGWYQDWCIIERERYQSMFLALLDKLIDYCMLHEQLEYGIECALRILHYDIARERTHRRLMRLYYLANNRTAALRQFEQCTTALAQELNVQPSRRTITLHRQIQEDDVKELTYSITANDSPLKETEAQPPSVLMELKQIRQMLLTLQQDIRAIKQAVHPKKDAPTDA